MKNVYSIVERKKDGKRFWLRIGHGVENKDGSLDIYLDAMPINGRLVVRDPIDRSREEDDQGTG